MRTMEDALKSLGVERGTIFYLQLPEGFMVNVLITYGDGLSPSPLFKYTIMNIE